MSAPQQADIDPPGRDLEAVISAFLERRSPGSSHFILENYSSSRNDDNVERLLEHLNNTSVTILTIRSKRIGLEAVHIIDLLSYIFPNLERLCIQCEHPPEPCFIQEEDNGYRSICGSAWIPERSIYELRIRNSWKVQTVCVDVFCSGTSVPRCIYKVFSDLRRSSGTYKLSTWLNG